MKKSGNSIATALLVGLCFALLVCLGLVFTGLHRNRSQEREMNAELATCREMTSLVRTNCARLGDLCWNYCSTRDTIYFHDYFLEIEQGGRLEKASELLETLGGRHFLYEKQMRESIEACTELRRIEQEAMALAHARASASEAALGILSDTEYRDQMQTVRNGIEEFTANVTDKLQVQIEEGQEQDELYLWAIVAISILFALLFIVLVIAVIRSRRSSRLDSAVITGLTEQYDCVMYVNNIGESRADISKLIRNDDSVTRVIPEWNGNISFKRRLQLMAENLVHPEDKEQFLEQTRHGLIFSHLEEGEDYDVSFRTLAGDEIHYYRMIFVADREKSGDPFRAGNILGICVGIINTDAIVGMEQERNSALEAAHKLEEAGKLKSLFVQNISHDIRTPLNAIVGYSQLLGMPDMYLSDEEKAEFSEYINNNAEILTMLVDDVLEMGDIESGNVKISLSDVNCDTICRKSVQSSKMRVAPGVRMYYTSDAGEDYTIHTDPRRVQQILSNFLSNACKHTETGEIHLHCSTKETFGCVTFSVTDTGTGVPEDMADDIFNRFASLDRLVGGHGLGLNICLDLSKRLGGRVSLDTSYKNGARFVLELPI